MSCLCHECGAAYEMDVDVSDDLWKQITPDGGEWDAGLLCPTCIFGRTVRLGKYKYYYLAVI